MADPVLHDAVTLNHFGSVGRLDILQTRHKDHEMPRWAEAVCEEIKEGAQRHLYCQRVLEADWLGDPATISQSENTKFFHLWIGLNDGQRPPTKHRGEAESIFVAERCHGIFLTDDSEAYAFAKKRPGLGSGRVKDSVDVLRTAVSMDELTAQEATDIALQIEANERYFRKEHQGKISAKYFNI